MTKKKASRNQRPAQTKRPSPSVANAKVAFAVHLQERRRRLCYIAISVVGWSAVAYAVQQKLVVALLKPSHGQSFVYTSPIGGVDFLFRVCLYTGIIMSIPVIIWQLLSYLAPLMKHSSTHFIAWGSFASGVLAVIGMTFGYFMGLPAALHFLLHQFQTSQIKPLISVQSYMSFVMVYMVGAALMLQVPLILIFINRIKPLK